LDSLAEKDWTAFERSQNENDDHPILCQMPVPLLQVLHCRLQQPIDPVEHRLLADDQRREAGHRQSPAKRGDLLIARQHFDMAFYHLKCIE
jgi:hypothetical protein